MIPEVTIVSISYNSASVYLEYWKSFLDSTTLEVIIVDNASLDGSGMQLSQLFPHRLVIQLDQNIGYGRAANVGIQQCANRFVLLLNPDLHISEEAVALLVDAARNDKDNVAIWAPAVTRADYSKSSPIAVDAVSGAAMLFDLEKMKSIGFFDENIFPYSEETVLCCRTRSAGFLIKLCPYIFVEHSVDKSSGHHSSLVFMKSWHFGWSRCYYLGKHKLFSKKHNSRRMFLNYKIKSYLSIVSLKRLRYRGQAAGVRAYLSGEKAFTADGLPQQYNVLRTNT